jgi:respiratory burst oxidase
MRAYAGDRATALRKAHFFWLNKDAYSFEWFAALLAQLEAIDRQQLLDIHIYMTAGRGHATSTALALAREILHSEQGRDLVTGLRAKTRMGHPDWDAELARIAHAAAPDRVDVYFCGPHGLARKLQATCARLGMTFREEKF